jgi:hypothetical protein
VLIAALTAFFARSSSDLDVNLTRSIGMLFYLLGIMKVSVSPDDLVQSVLALTSQWMDLKIGIERQKATVYRVRHDERRVGRG